MMWIFFLQKIAHRAL